MAVTDLTGCTWVGNATAEWPGTVSYSINMECVNMVGEPTTSGSLRTSEQSSGPERRRAINFEDVFFNYGYGDYYSGAAGATTLSKTVDDPASDVITFTGGTDATNAELIAWLEANGTLTAPPEPHDSLASLFSDIADAIRSKTGGSGTIVADNFPEEISGIPMKFGTLTLSSSASNLEFSHNLGVTPNIVVVGSTSTSSSNTNRAFMINGISRSLRGTTTAPTSVTITANAQTVSIPRSGGYSWGSGSYVWMVGKI